MLLDFGNVLPNVIIILVFDLKHVKHIKILTLLAVTLSLENLLFMWIAGLHNYNRRGY